MLETNLEDFVESCGGTCLREYKEEDDYGNKYWWLGYLDTVGWQSKQVTESFGSRDELGDQ